MDQMPQGACLEPPPKVRLALFVSFYRGLAVLDELLQGPSSGQIEIVGLATDDPQQSFVNPANRVWGQPHTRYEEVMVAEWAQQHGIPVFTGRVKSDLFYETLESVWRPDVCVMGTFGQKIDTRLHRFPRLGFFNLHPCAVGEWPTRYPGPNPYGEMMEAGVRRLQIALHRVGDDFDRGELMGLSDTVPIPRETTVVDMHKLSAAAAARLVAQALPKIVAAARQ